MSAYFDQTEWGLTLFTEDGDIIASADPDKKEGLIRLCLTLKCGPYYGNQINPYSAPLRFTDEETIIFDHGKCCWVTAYGMPWTEHCEADSAPGADFGYCEYHADPANRL